MIEFGQAASLFPKGYVANAVISECGLYRLMLERRHKEPSAPSLLAEPLVPKTKGMLLVIMLNPSTADHRRNDATIRTLLRLTKQWGYEGFYVLNLYSYRTSKPSELLKLSPEVAIGPDNSKYLAHYIQQSSDVLVGWGNNANPQRAADVLAMVTQYTSRVYCVGCNKNGSPKHPLYTADSTPLTRYPEV